MISTIDKYKGCLMGLAVGDAIGTTSEFKPPNTFDPTPRMIGGGPFNLEAGQWTDDTSMTLCLGQSLIDTYPNFNIQDQLQKYWKWYKEGYMSSNGKCFDIGITTASALTKWKRSGGELRAPDTPTSSGNGSIMRLAPIPMRYLTNKNHMILMSEWSSKSTHASQMCIESCIVLSLIISGALLGKSKQEICSSMYGKEFLPYQDKIKSPEVLSIWRDCAYKNKTKEQISGKGFVITTLECALWSFWNAGNYRDTIGLCYERGHDTDTTCAVAGSIAGAYYGYDGIPKEWKNKIAKKELILEMSETLFKLK